MKNSAIDIDPNCRYRRPDDGLPWFVHFNVTTRCNMRCAMCQSNLVDRTLGPTKDVLSFIDRLGDWLPMPRQVVLTGGEPLLHPDIVDFVRRLADVGFIPSLNTNGALLGVQTVDELIDAGLKIINFSIDGIGAIHDNQRKGPGLYQGVMNMIDHITTHTELIVSIVSVIATFNAQGLPDLVRLISKNPQISGIRFQAVVPVLSMPWHHSFFEESDLWPQTARELNQVMDTLDELRSLKEQGFPIRTPFSQFDLWERYFRDPKNLLAERPCTIADDNLIIQPDGSVLFCNQYGQLGTIQDDPKAMWNSDIAKKMRTEMKRCKHPCNFVVNCSYLED